MCQYLEIISDKLDSQDIMSIYGTLHMYKLTYESKSPLIMLWVVVLKETKILCLLFLLTSRLRIALYYIAIR